MGKIEITEAQEKHFGEDELNFIFSQASQQLKESIDSGNIVVTRSAILLSLTLAFFTTSIGYILSKKVADYDTLVYTLLIGCLYLIYVLIKIRFNLMGHDYYTTGSMPEHLLHSAYIEDCKKKKGVHALLITEIRSYQSRIEDNNKLNKKRWKSFKRCLNMLTFYPLLLITIFLLIHYYFDLLSVLNLLLLSVL